MANYFSILLRVTIIIVFYLFRKNRRLVFSEIPVYIQVVTHTQISYLHDLACILCSKYMHILVGWNSIILWYSVYFQCPLHSCEIIISIRTLAEVLAGQSDVHRNPPQFSPILALWCQRTCSESVLYLSGRGLDMICWESDFCLNYPLVNVYITMEHHHL